MLRAEYEYAEEHRKGNQGYPCPDYDNPVENPGERFFNIGVVIGALVFLRPEHQSSDSFPIHRVAEYTPIKEPGYA